VLAAHVNEPVVKFKKLYSHSQIPRKGTTGSARYDLYLSESAVVFPKSRVLVSTGIACELLPSTYGQIKSRSSIVYKNAVDVKAGVINSDYRGEIKVLLHNDSNETYHVTTDQAVAQMIFLPLQLAKVVETNDLSRTERSDQGFRSTNQPIASTHAAETSYQLTKVVGQPPGTTFLGARLSQTNVRLGLINGKSTPIVIDSGSNITLISTKLLDSIKPSLREKQGQSI